VDEIQRWLRMSLDAGPEESLRDDLLTLLQIEGDHVRFVLHAAIDASETQQWWYDTLVEFARRWRQPDGWDGKQELPAEFVNWCIGVAGNEITRPKRRGRPTKHLRDKLIRRAVDAYAYLPYGEEPVSRTKACARVAEVVGLDESVVARIWRREKQVK